MLRFLAALAFVFSGPAAAVDVGAPAPDLAILSSVKGKVAYVDFWASWCVPCRTSMPALDALYRRNRERGFAVVGVNKDVSPADAERFLKRVSVSFFRRSTKRSFFSRNAGFCRSPMRNPMRRTLSS